MTTSTKLAFAIFLATFHFSEVALAEITCVTLLEDKCAFAVASSGDRCVLETYTARGRFTEYQCKTSNVKADAKLAGHVESDQCVSEHVGLDGKASGLVPILS